MGSDGERWVVQSKCVRIYLHFGDIKDRKIPNLPH